MLRASRKPENKKADKSGETGIYLTALLEGNTRMFCLAFMAVLFSAVESPNAILLQAGRDLKVRSIATGRQHPILQRAAQAHADYQARVGVQGHQFWDRRAVLLMEFMPDCHEFREVANESWPGQGIRDAAKEMYRSWKLSPGHWSAVNGRCSYYGYAMARGSNGIWYACGIFADVR